jgi:hypothetical protein
MPVNQGIRTYQLSNSGENKNIPKIFQHHHQSGRTGFQVIDINNPLNVQTAGHLVFPPEPSKILWWGILPSQHFEHHGTVIRITTPAIHHRMGAFVKLFSDCVT